MVNPKALSTPGVTSNPFLESNISNFFDDAEIQSAPSIEGQWFTIRLIPDLVAGEIFNVGVAFLDSNAKLHFQIIPTARPFKCLFGDAGLDNFGFLLNVIRKRLTDNIIESTPSPHIVFTEPTYASGTTVDEIISSLYHTMVNLQCDDIDDGGVLLDKQPLGTEVLRKSIMGRVKKNMPMIYEQIFQKEPIHIEDPTTKSSFYLDMPIWNKRGNLFNDAPTCFGTIISTAYKTKIHRGFYLEHGCTQIRNTCEIVGKKSKAGFIIFRAPPDTKGFTESLNAQIDNELDRTLNTLERMKKEGYPIDITITSDKNVIYEKTLELA